MSRACTTTGCSCGRGFLNNLVGTQVRQPDGAEAMKATLRPVNKFGFKQAIENLLGVYEEAKSKGDLKESFGGYAQVSGRKAIVLNRELPPKGDYPAFKTITYIDLEYLVPIGIEGFDWDEQLTAATSTRTSSSTWAWTTRPSCRGTTA